MKYRITRPDGYKKYDCYGNRDVSARQGYYVEAASPADALAEMRSSYPGENLTAQECLGDLLFVVAYYDTGLGRVVYPGNSLFPEHP